MPWKDGYTISDEKSLDDKDVRWPEGKRCAVHIVVDLSMAGGPGGHIGEGRPQRDRPCSPPARGSTCCWRRSPSMGSRRPSRCPR